MTDTEIKIIVFTVGFLIGIITTVVVTFIYITSDTDNESFNDDWNTSQEHQANDEYHRT